MVQSDQNDVRLINTIVAIITKTTHRATREPTQLLIDITSPEGRQSGLLHSSAINCEHLGTVPIADVIRVICSLSATTMTRVEGCLKAALAIPEETGS
jgi:mRNA interferase MazF